MRIERRTRDGVTLLRVHGNVTINGGSADLRLRVRDAVLEGDRRLVLNLGGVKYMDSTGIGALVASYTTVVNGGGLLRLSNLNEKIVHLLSITRLLTVFTIFGDEKQALENLTSSTKPAATAGENR